MANIRYNSDEAQAMAIAFYLFGFNCVSCKTVTDVRFLTVEHLVAQSKGGKTDKNVYPACYHCNMAKMTKTAEKFFTNKETLSYILETLKNDVSANDIKMTLIEYCEIFIGYAQTIENCSLSAKVMSLMTSSELFPTFKNYDLSNVLISGSEKQVANFAKKFDLSKCRVVIN